jgi:hypothetical protein
VVLQSVATVSIALALPGPTIPATQNGTYSMAQADSTSDLLRFDRPRSWGSAPLG